MRTKVVVVIGLVLALLSVAAAKPRPFEGKWKLVGVVTKDGPVPKSKLDKGGMIWEFKGDGTLDMTVTSGDKSATAKATWTLAGDKLSITESGKLNVVTFKRKGANLVIAGTGASSVVMTFSPPK
jgi:hypothetical protein